MKKYRTFIIIMILIAIGVAYYYYLASKDKTVEKGADTEISEVSKLVNKDLENSFPATPREVVELYSRMLTCFYGEKYSDEEFEKLASQSRLLFDEELNSQNPYEDYIKNLESEIKQYKEEKKKISTYIIEKSGDIEYKTFQSHFYAKVECVYYIKGEGVTSRTLETYTLRKDETGKWRILYWSLTPVEEDE